MSERYYYRRSLSQRTGASSDVVYVVIASEGPRTDPVEVMGAFPPRWRPTELPGQVLADSRATVLYARCLVPRSQFRHYQRLSETEARALYPNVPASESAAPPGGRTPGTAPR